MITVVIQIGNSDGKLTQKEWSHFVARVKNIVEMNSYVVHFCGGSDWDAPWQNACWVVELTAEQSDEMRSELISEKLRWHQDSIAITTGETKFN